MSSPESSTGSPRSGAWAVSCVTGSDLPEHRLCVTGWPFSAAADQVVRGCRLVVALVMGAALTVACAGGAQRPVVAVEEVRSGEVAQTVSAPARVEAAARQAVAAGVRGTVAAIEVEDGDQVQAGQLVVRLSAAEGTPASELTVEAPFAGTVSTAQSSDGGTAAGLPELGGLPQAPASSGGAPLRRGSHVSPGQTLFTVYDLSQLYVVADIAEVDIPQLEEGQEARVLIDAIEDGVFLGVVDRIAIEAATTEAGGTGFPVRIRIEGPAPDQQTPPDLGVVRVGMTSSVEITIQTQESDLVVPSRALLRRSAETIAFVVRDGVAHQVPVEVAVLGEDSAAVTGDLRTGEAVVVTGSEDLRDGQPVMVQ